MLCSCFHFGSGMLAGQKDGNMEFDDENNLETVTSTRSGSNNKKENNSSISAVRL